MRIDGGKIVEFTPEVDGAVFLEGKAKIDLFTRYPFEVGKQPRGGMGILPDMPAGSLTAANAFPGIEPAIAQPIASRSGQDRGVQESPVEEPIREA